MLVIHCEWGGAQVNLKNMAPTEIGQLTTTLVNQYQHVQSDHGPLEPMEDRMVTQNKNMRGVDEKKCGVAGKNGTFFIPLPLKSQMEYTLS